MGNIENQAKRDSDGGFSGNRNPIPLFHESNPNSILRCFRNNARIMSEKLDHGAAGEISKSHFMFIRILGHG